MKTMEGESCLLQLRRWQRRQDSLGRNPAGPIGPLSRAFFGAVESAPQELEQWRQHMAVERSVEIQCAEVRRPRGFPPKIGRDLPKIGRSRKRRESARNAASSLFWAARPPLSYFPLTQHTPHNTHNFSIMFVTVSVCMVTLYMTSSRSLLPAAPHGSNLIRDFAMLRHCAPPSGCVRTAGPRGSACPICISMLSSLVSPFCVSLFQLTGSARPSR